MQMVDATSKLCPEIVLCCDNWMFWSMSSIKLDRKMHSFLHMQISDARDQLMKPLLWLSQDIFW